MFTGDNVLGHGTAVFENLSLYLGSLEKMQNIWVEEGGGKEEGCAYPGHGAVLKDGKGKILEYIAHRKQREDEVFALLKSKRSKDGVEDAGSSGERNNEWASMELVKIIYKYVPESLHLPAQMGVLQILRKLKDEGKVEEVASSRKWRMKEREKL